MSTEIDILFENELHIGAGLNYLVPLQWWELFSSLNSHPVSKQSLVYPSQTFHHCYQSFLFDFRQEIVAELETKCNYLKFEKVLCSPQIKKNIQWKIISPKLWKILQKGAKDLPCILTITKEADPHSFISQNLLQIQIVFCCKTKSDAFIGFLPEGIEIVKVVREVGFEMGYVEVQNSRIMFPSYNSQKIYYYFQQEQIPLKQASDTTIMAFGLQKIYDQSDKQIGDKSFNLPNSLPNSSVEGNAGDLDRDNSWLLDDAAAAGAVPFHFSSDEEKKIFKIGPLLKEKSKEEVEILKIQGESNIKGEMINIPEYGQDELGYELQKCAQELLSKIEKMEEKEVIVEIGPPIS